MSPQKIDQINELEENLEDEIQNRVISSQVDSIEKWVTYTVHLISQISSTAINIQKQDSNGNILPVSYESTVLHIESIFKLLQSSIYQIQDTLSHISELNENNFVEIVNHITLFNQISHEFEKLKNPFIDLMDLIDYSEYSFCSTCLILEKTLDFEICEKCHSLLFKGPEIRELLITQYFSKEIQFPTEIINTLKQRFKSKINEISFEANGIINKRQLVEVPVDLKLRPDRTYTFFVIDETKKLVPLEQSEFYSESPNATSISNIETCRNCNSKMRFLRSTVYYETTADLYQCPKCKMEMLTNFKPIWESNIKDEEN